MGWLVGEQAKKNGLLTHQLHTSHRFHYICKKINIKDFFGNLACINVHLIAILLPQPQLNWSKSIIHILALYLALSSQLITDHDKASQLESSYDIKNTFDFNKILSYTFTFQVAGKNNNMSRCVRKCLQYIRNTIKHLQNQAKILYTIGLVLSTNSSSCVSFSPLSVILQV